MNDGEEICLVRLDSVDNEAGLIQWKESTWVADFNPKPYHLLRNGDVLIPARGANRTAILVSNPPSRAVADRTFFVARPDQKKIVPRFLLWYLNDERAQHYLRVHSQGTKIQAVKKSALERLPVRVPNLDVQGQISEVDRLLKRERELVAKWVEAREELARTVLRRKLNLRQ
jgi:restriction endonuclease S subunit